MTKPRLFYVYLLRRAIDGEIVYVGKGCGSRCDWHNKIGARHPNVLLRCLYAEHGPFTVVKVLETLDEQGAFNYEQFLIGTLGRRDNGTGSLANRTNGGEGSTGWKHPHEVRARMSASRAGHAISDATRAAISATQKGRIITPEHRAKISKALVGRVCGQRHKHSAEARAKMSAAAKLRKSRVATDITRAKLSAIAHRRWERERANANG